MPTSTQMMSPQDDFANSAAIVPNFESQAEIQRPVNENKERAEVGVSSQHTAPVADGATNGTALAPDPRPRPLQVSPPAVSGPNLLGAAPADPETGLIAVSSHSSLGGSAGSNGSASGNHTLYLGNLHPFVSEATLQEVFSGLGGITELKVIKDKATGVSAGYGFAKFSEAPYAQAALDRVNKVLLFGQEVRINWAFQKEQQEEVANHVHIFVGDLSPDVTDATLLAAFQHCLGCSDARVMWDHATGRSRGYGFVSFRQQADAEGAIATVHGQFVGARRVRCGWAQHKTEVSVPVDAGILNRADPTNTNVYVGNLAPQLTDTEVRRHFGAFGAIAEVKLYRKGAYGFVRYKAHEDALRAIVGMNGAALGGKMLKCSWGRHPNTPPSGVQASLMLAAAAGVNPLGLGQGPHAGAMVGHSMGHSMGGPMGLMGPGALLGMPMAGGGAQGIVGGSGMGGHQGGLGQDGRERNGLGGGGGGLMPLDHSQMGLYSAAHYGLPHYAQMGQMMGQQFFAGQQQRQN